MWPAEKIGLKIRRLKDCGHVWMKTETENVLAKSVSVNSLSPKEDDSRKIAKVERWLYMIKGLFIFLVCQAVHFLPKAENTPRYCDCTLQEDQKLYLILNRK